MPELSPSLSSGLAQVEIHHGAEAMAGAWRTAATRRCHWPGSTHKVERLRALGEAPGAATAPVTSSARVDTIACMSVRCG